MVFPQTPLDVLVELWINGAWVDVTDDVYVAEKIVIVRGRADEGARVDPGKCSLVFNGRLGTYSRLNPMSPYYMLIGRNTLIRVSVRAGTQFLSLPGVSTAYASTPDAAALDITADIDVRVDAQLTNWLDASDGLSTTELMGKIGGASSNKSWFLGVRSNRLYFEWSADGTSVLSASSTISPVVPANGRLAVRATLDVNNGASGRTITFYTAPSGVDGTWTQLGDPVVQAGVTSIFNSTAAVQVGVVPVLMTYAAGRVHAVQIRNGIAGSVVANCDFTIQDIGDTSFADSAGRTWTVNGTASITNRRTRFIGEVSSWPSRWDVSGNDVRVPVEAAGILRRLGQGAKALDSTLRRRIPSYTPLAYWPAEDGENATQAASPIAGVRPLKLTRVTWASADSLPSSKALPVLASSGTSLPRMHGRIPALSGATLTSWSVRYIYRLDTAPTTLRTFFRILSTGTVAEWYIQQRNDLSRIFGLDNDGATVFTQDIVTGSNLYDGWINVRLTATQNGGNVDWGITWFIIGGEGGSFGTSFAGTVGRPTGVASPPDGYSADLDGMALGHISAWPSNTTAAYSGAIDAWAGETAAERMTRLADEENLSLVTRLGDVGQEEVGPQRPDTLLNLLGQAAEADGGILYEQREAVGLTYRDRGSLYNRAVGLALDYTADGEVAPPLEPVDDDQKVRNDVTVEREGGAAARLTLDEGALSTAAPPDGVGVYDESVTLNLFDDSQPEQHAAWRLHLGTVDEARYPVVHVDLAAAPHLIDDVTDLDSGDRITIDNLPDFLPPGPADLLAQGYTETIGHPIDWDVEINCTPGSPWQVGVIGDDVQGRLDTSGSELAAGVDDNDLSLSVNTTAGPRWTTDAANFPFDIRLGGEVMTVTSISGTSNPQTFTIGARSVNGIAKAHSSGTSLSLAYPMIIALQGGTRVATYPPVYAGQKATAAFVQSMLPLTVVKAATETVTSSATFQDDDELFLPAEASGVYHFSLFLLHSAGTTGKFKCQFTAPSGATVNWGVHGVHVNQTSSTTVADMSVPSRLLSDSQQLGGGNLAGTTALIQGVLTMSSTAGNLQLQWAQITSDAAATQVRAGSVLTMRRVA